MVRNHNSVKHINKENIAAVNNTKDNTKNNNTNCNLSLSIGTMQGYKSPLTCVFPIKNKDPNTILINYSTQKII